MMNSASENNSKLSVPHVATSSRSRQQRLKVGTSKKSITATVAAAGTKGKQGINKKHLVNLDSSCFTFAEEENEFAAGASLTENKLLQRVNTESKEESP